MNNQETNVSEEEKVETPVENIETVAPDPFAKGRERIAVIGGFFSKAKEKFSEVKKSASATLSRFWSRTKSAAGETAAAVLSVDDLAKKGVQYVGGKIVEEGQYVAQAAEMAGDRLEDSYDWLSEKTDEVGNFMDASWDKATAFTQDKVEQVKTFAKDKVELAKDIAFYAKEKTNQGLDKAKEGIKNRWGQLVSFGEGAVAEGKLKIAKAKESYRNTMNTIRENRLRAEYEKAIAQESEASEKALILKAKREALEGKMGLLQGLEVSVAA